LSKKMMQRSEYDKPAPIIISGYSSQNLAEQIAQEFGGTRGKVKYKQFADREIQPIIEEVISGRDVVIVTSAAGEPNKQVIEASRLIEAAWRAEAKTITAVVPYMLYGCSDDIWDDRVEPGLVSTIKIWTRERHLDNAIVCDPHNQGMTRETFLAGGARCRIAHFAFPIAIQIKSLIDHGYISKDNLVLAHADAGSTKRIGRSFRACMYKILGYPKRNSDKDDWPQGLKDHDKDTGDTYYKGFSTDVKGKDVVITEDMIRTGGTACDLAKMLKDMGARSVILFATNGLFTTDWEKGEKLTASVDKINRSQLDAVFIMDTYDHSLTDPKIRSAIAHSPKIHVMKSAPYLATMIRARHLDVREGMPENANSISAILKGTHPDQQGDHQKVYSPTRIKRSNPLVEAKAVRLG